MALTLLRGVIAAPLHKWENPVALAPLEGSNFDPYPQMVNSHGTSLLPLLKLKNSLALTPLEGSNRDRSPQMRKYHGNSQLREG